MFYGFSKELVIIFYFTSFETGRKKVSSKETDTCNANNANEVTAEAYQQTLNRNKGTHDNMKLY